jgi:hypothetical protein
MVMWIQTCRFFSFHANFSADLKLIEAENVKVVKIVKTPQKQFDA